MSRRSGCPNRTGSDPTAEGAKSLNIRACQQMGEAPRSEPSFVMSCGILPVHPKILVIPCPKRSGHGKKGHLSWSLDFKGFPRRENDKKAIFTTLGMVANNFAFCSPLPKMNRANNAITKTLAKNSSATTWCLGVSKDFTRVAGSCGARALGPRARRRPARDPAVPRSGRCPQLRVLPVESFGGGFRVGVFFFFFWFFPPASWFCACLVYCWLVRCWLVCCGLECWLCIACVQLASILLVVYFLERQLLAGLLLFGVPWRGLLLLVYACFQLADSTLFLVYWWLVSPWLVCCWLVYSWLVYCWLIGLLFGLLLLILPLVGLQPVGAPLLGLLLVGVLLLGFLLVGLLVVGSLLASLL